MNFAFSEEQEQLRDFVRQFLENYSSETTVRELMETDQGYDPDTWSMMAEQLGLQSLIIPEEHGGQGFGYVELIVVLEEMGRVLLCAPFFSTVVLAANTLIHAGDDDAAARVLPGIASGETIATLAFTEESGRWDEGGIAMEATADGDGWTLSGTKTYVLDGHLADVVLVAARTPGGVSLLEVAGDADGLTRTALATMDLTRKQARLDFDGVSATLVGTEGGAWPVIERVLDLAAVALAAEQVGGAQVCLDTAVQYAKDRIQFGRPIGSFQAIAGQGLLLGGLLPHDRREHPDPRRHRLHVGAPGPPVLQAGQELRVAVRRPHLPPRVARPAHRDLSGSGTSSWGP